MIHCELGFLTVDCTLFSLSNLPRYTSGVSHSSEHPVSILKGHSSDLLSHFLRLGILQEMYLFYKATRIEATEPEISGIQ